MDLGKFWEKALVLENPAKGLENTVNLDHQLAHTPTQDTGNTPVGSTEGYALGQQLSFPQHLACLAK